MRATRALVAEMAGVALEEVVFDGQRRVQTPAHGPATVVWRIEVDGVVRVLVVEADSQPQSQWFLPGQLTDLPTPGGRA